MVRDKLSEVNFLLFWVSEIKSRLSGVGDKHLLNHHRLIIRFYQVMFKLCYERTTKQNSKEYLTAVITEVFNKWRDFRIVSGYFISLSTVI